MELTSSQSGLISHLIDEIIKESIEGKFFKEISYSLKCGLKLYRSRKKSTGIFIYQHLYYKWTINLDDQLSAIIWPYVLTSDFKAMTVRPIVAGSRDKNALWKRS